MKAASQPFSLRLDEKTISRATAFAKRRKIGVTTALRMLIADQLDAIEGDAELGAALHWQQKETAMTLERWQRGEVKEVSLAQLRATHAKALKLDK